MGTHAATRRSRDYLDGYGTVMKPGLAFTPPVTLRLGTPAATIVDKILEPMLKERVQPLVGKCFVWRGAPPSSAAATTSSVTSVFASLEYEGLGE